MKTKIISKDFRVRPSERVALKQWATPAEPICKSKKQYQTLLEHQVAELSDLQRLNFASNRHALLLIFQPMDAAGKDGAIRHVMSGINPQGCQVFSFKQPGADELDHDFPAKEAGLSIQVRDPFGVERLGLALDPEAAFERRPCGGGGCEDARVTYVEPIQRYVMTDPALSSSDLGIALEMSADLLHSERIGHQLCHSAGVMVLSKEHLQTILYRSPQPVLKLESPEEFRETISNVVFPTGMDRLDDLGTPDRFDVYYGMATTGLKLRASSFRNTFQRGRRRTPH